MANLAEFHASHKFKALVYGPSKVGKTFFAATFPRPNFLDFDRGMQTLLGADFIKKHGFRKDVQFQTFTETERTPAGVPKNPKAFDAACKYFDDYMKPDKRDTFDTWVIDTGTTLSQLAQYKAIWLMGGRLKGIKSETYGDSQTHGLIIPKVQDYGAERSMVEQFVEMVQSCDKNVLFLCHQKEVTNDEGTVTGIVPLLTGKAVEAICLMFDDIWYLQARRSGTDMKRELVTQTNGIIKAGSRLGIPSGTEASWEAVSTSIEATRASVNKLIK